MSIEIGSNFMYRGKKYLDDRLNDITSLNDLKNWDISTIPIPDGFEVFYDGYWYTYNSGNKPNEKTGCFKKRSEIIDSLDEVTNSYEVGVSQKVLVNKFGVVDSKINTLFAATFPLSFASFTFTKNPNNNTANYSIWTTPFNPKFIWNLKYEGIEGTLPTTSYSVQIKEGSEDWKTVSGTEEKLDNTLTWTSSSAIGKYGTPITISYRISASYKDNSLGGIESTITKDISYNFMYKRYYGVSSSASLSSSDVISFEFDLSNGSTKSSTTFNCTGGKYPYFVIPTAVYNKHNPEWWIGGLKNTDLEIQSDIDIEENESGISIPYTAIRLGNTQTGKLNIEFK